MAARDFITEVMTKLWELCEARTEWTDLIPAGNRIRYDTIQGIQNPKKSNTADGDYDQCEIVHTGGADDLQESSNPTFGTYAAVPCVDFLESVSLTYHVIVTSPTLRAGSHHKAGIETIAAIRAGGPRLGVADANSVRLRWETVKTELPEDEMVRWKTTITVTLRLEADTSVISGE